ncbi:hypothetical protein D3C72_267830 [compost metagenome]
MPIINTGEVTELINNTRRLQKIKQQIGSLRYYSEMTPKLRLPTGSQNWEAIGKEIGMPGLEAEMIWNEILNNPSDHEIATIKKLLLVGKLTHTKPTLDYQLRCQSAQTAFDTEFQRCEDAKTKVIELEAELQEVMRASEFTDMMESWQRLIDNVQKYVEERENVVSRFKGHDRAFFELLKTNSKYVRVEVDETTGVELAVVIWDKVRNSLNIEHVHTILRKWAAIMEKESA